MKSQRLAGISRILIVVLVIGFSIYIYTMRERVQELEGLGYSGIFLFNVLSNATLILPVPGVLVTSLLGGVFHPFWVAVAAGSGASIGELSGYLLGFSGKTVIERTPVYVRMENWMRKYGEWAVLLLAFIPNPLFDMAGIIAGAIRMHVLRFLLWCWLGKVLKMLVFAYGGATIINIFPFQ
jgi:membrane protein YqaA with SNARE-associated domain